MRTSAHPDVKFKLIKNLVICAILAVSFGVALLPTKTSNADTKISETLSVRQQIEKEFPNAPVMVRIAYCESKFRQFNPDGTVYRGKLNPKDVGVFQVNEHYHLADSKKMGINIYSVAGNIQYARYLYNHEGTTPWDWSKSCWG